MSESKEHPRPPQTTMLGWLILLGSVYVSLMAFDALGSLRTLASTEMVEEMLKEMGNPAGVTVADGVAVLRFVTVVGAVASAAAAVLGFFVLRRDRGARIGLTVLAVPLALSSLLAGGFISFMVVAAILLLWLQPSRNWFAGLPPIEPPARLKDQPKIFSSSNERDEQGGAQRSADDQQRSAPSAPQWRPVVGDQSSDARPMQGYGSTQVVDQARPAVQGDAPTPYTPTPYAQNPYVQQPGQQPGQQRGVRPKQVLTAAIVTFAFSGLALLSCLVTFAVGLAADEAFFQDLLEQQPMLAEQGIAADQLGPLMAFTSAILGFFCLLGMGAAGLMLTGNPVGRVLLVMVAAAVLAFSLVGMLSSPLLVATAVAAGATIHQLTRPEVTAWFRLRR